MLPVVAITNQSTVLTDEQVAAALPALRRQAQLDFYAYWSVRCELMPLAKGMPLPAGWWQIVILDDPDQAGALGYHELSEAGTPMGKVFAKLDLEAGSSWTVTISHELLEMLVDPWINACSQGSDDKIYALEVCDAVEADALGYTIDRDADGNPAPATLVSDFVTPSWFAPTEAKVYDFLGHLKSSLKLAPGGYISVYGPSGWTQLNAERVLSQQEAPRGSRRDRRTVPFSSWRKSQPAKIQ